MPFVRTALISAAALSVSISIASAQTRPISERLATIHQSVSTIKDQAIYKLPPRLQQALSGGALNYLQFATAWQNIEQSFGDEDEQAKIAALRNALTSAKQAAGIVASGPIPVSNPGTDFLFSVMAGFTQSETSTAWCGSGAVVGFNDSGSQFETGLFGPGGISFAGAGVSSDGGASFRDIGAINPGPNTSTFLAGDPVVSCTNASTFYFSQIGSSATVSGTTFTPVSAVFVSKSTNGGYSWDDPIQAVAKDGFTHSLDKDWSTVDPNRPKNIYVSYTDFDLTFTSCPSERIAIEIVHSADGGLTWSAPTVLDQVCSTTGQFVQGSQIVVDSAGRVYVEWEYFPNGFATDVRELRIARSSNRATSFGPVLKISDAVATGDGFALQGNFRTFLTGSLAVDRSGTKTDGNLYLTWEDGRLRSRTDLESPFGLYRNANVLFTSSRDGGKTWSAPVRVNDDPLESRSTGFGIDHFQPGVAADSTGTVAACWYDRRDSLANYHVSRYCGVSVDAGTTWANTRVDPTSWQPIHATDTFINVNYLGDYDTLATDQLKTATGFLGAYGNVTVNAPVPNQDVFAIHLDK